MCGNIESRLVTCSNFPDADLIKMSQDSSPISQPSRRKCANCGLVNAGSDEQCRRCGALLDHHEFASPIAAQELPAAGTKKRGLLKRVIWIAGVTLVLLIIWYASLVLSSNGLQPDQRDKVRAAIALLEQQGFTHEAFILKHLATFRSTDNWLNSNIGHRDAYAATNFPFEIVTLYPDFFQMPIDDRERAAVLLHEARHLLGDGEEAALHFTWINKRQLGWTTEKYSGSAVWDATARLTRVSFPYMFQCGADGKSDCY
jgi:hypothetical protein